MNTLINESHNILFFAMDQVVTGQWWHIKMGANPGAPKLAAHFPITIVARGYRVTHIRAVVDLGWLDHIGAHSVDSNDA